MLKVQDCGCVDVSWGLGYKSLEKSNLGGV